MRADICLESQRRQSSQSDQVFGGHRRKISFGNHDHGHSLGSQRRLLGSFLVLLTVMLSMSVICVNHVEAFSSKAATTAMMGRNCEGHSSILFPLNASSASFTPSSDPRRKFPRSNQNQPTVHRTKNNPAQSSTTVVESRWQRAVRIETRTQLALEHLQQLLSKKDKNSGHHRESLKTRQEGEFESSLAQSFSPAGKNSVIIRRSESGILSSVPSGSSVTSVSSPSFLQNNNSQLAFPDIRECNSALAAFGDGGDLLRALRLYFKMRKATQIALSATMNDDTKVHLDESAEAAAKLIEAIVVPTPTLVTYSTLMSRAVSLGKPQVALRLWKIMRDQADFFSYTSHTSIATGSTSSTSIKASDLQNLIVPDVKAANILMNTYAKLGDIEGAEDLMMQMQTRPKTHSHRSSTNGDRNQNSLSLASFSHEVIFGGGKDVPYLSPNLVTYNTLLDACQKTGELDKALHWKKALEHQSQPNGLGNDRTNITYRNGRTRSIRLRPDARTHTSLIGTVARKSRQITSSSKTSTTNGGSTSNYYGTHDPSLAFQLLDEMKTKHRITPNPLTYSALIDVCGRCRRSDLALKALRLMLRDEQMQRRMKALSERKNRNTPIDVNLDQQTVGAWTAAINACGKTGRIDTALKLFFVSMPRFNVKPNVITCSCLLDSLLKQGKTAESLDVLRYMKSNNLRPSEFMYTSLMTYASRLAGLEQQVDNRGNNPRHQRKEPRRGVTFKETSVTAFEEEFDDDMNRPWPSLLDSNGPSRNENENVDDKDQVYSSGDEDDTKAVNVYSELMSTLIGTTKHSQKVSRQGNENDYSHRSEGRIKNELYQVTMVFREMKASGVVPDLGSYNTLLRSCANSGDIDRAKEILLEIKDPSNDLEPTDRTWRAVLRAAGKAKRSDMVLQTWNNAIAEVSGSSDHDPDPISKREENHVSSSTSTKTSPQRTHRKKKSSNLSVDTFRAFLTALLICAWDLRKSDRYTSVELYRIIIKCYNALRSSSVAEKSSNTSTEESPSSRALPDDLERSYMGMHLVDPSTAIENPLIIASILQAVVNLESLLDEGDEWRGKLKQLGVALAKTSCLSESSTPTSTDEQSPKSELACLSFFDKKALKSVKKWF